MGALTLAQASLLSQDKLIMGIAKEILTIDSFADQLVFVPANGKALVHDRELTESGATFLDVGGTSNATQATVTQITQPLGRISGDVIVDDFAQATLSHDNDQTATQMTLKSKAIGRTWKDAVITGTGTFPQFTGISNLMATSQVIQASATTSGASMTLALLDQLGDQVTAKDGELDFYTMNLTLKRKYQALVRSQGFTNAEVEIGFLNPITGQRGTRLILAYDSVPIFSNDYIATESTNGSPGKHRVFAGVFGEQIGVTGITPRDGNSGIRVTAPFHSETKDETIRRLKMYTGLALFSTKALAELSNLLGT